MPRVSVIIPVYNRPTMALRAAQSVLLQEFLDFELILVDDGSTLSLSDAQRLVELAEQQYIRTERKGVASARNTGVAAASGDWIAFLDSDDYWLPEKLSRQVRFHEENSEYTLSQCEERWHRNGKRVNKRRCHAMASGYAFNASLARCCISASSVMIQRKAFDELGGFDERLWVCEDYDLWIRATRKYEVGLIEEELVFKFGGHADQLSRSEPAMDRYRLFSILKLIQNNGLNENQLKEACRVAREKAAILLSGARKRAPQSCALYEDISDKMDEFDEARRSVNLQTVSERLLSDLVPARLQRAAFV